MDNTPNPAVRRTVLASSALALVFACASYAQQAPAPTPAPATPADAKKAKETADAVAAAKPADGALKDDDVVTMNPFVIEADSDVGYLASQSLAGSRLNTSIKDIANQIQVMTPEFLADIAAVDADDAFRYSINTENGAELAGTGSQFFGQGGGTNVAAGNRTRGLTGASNTRNFFKTAIPTDRYNSNNRGLTIAGGPNAILFGLGSASGVADSSDDEASTTKSKTKISTTVDSNNSRRYELSTAVPLIRKKLGLAVAALESRKHFNLESTFENDRRLYGNINWSITKNITFSSKAEIVDRDANRPVYLFPKDRVTLWLNPGFGNSVPVDNLPNQSSPGGIYNGWSAGGAPTLTTGGNMPQGIYFYRYSTGVNPVGQMDQLGITGLTNGNLNDDSTFVDEKIYPFSKYGVYGVTHPAELNAKRFTQNFQAKLLPNLFLEIAHNYEYTKQRSVNFRPTDAALSIDPNANAYRAGYIPLAEPIRPVLQANPTPAQVTAYNNALATYNATMALPATQATIAANAANRIPNDNVGGLYIEGHQTASKQDFWSRETRASLAYMFDARKHVKGTLGKMLGTHQISTNTSLSTLRNRSQGSFFRLVQDNGVDANGYGIAPSVITTPSLIDGPTAVRYMLPGGNVNNDNNRKLKVRAYVNPNDPNNRVANLGGYDPFGTWSFTDINGQNYNAGLFDNGGAGADARGRITENFSKAFAWKANILKDYVVLTYGRRWDDVRFKRFDPEYTSFDPRTGLFPVYNNLPWTRFTEKVTKQNETKAIVVKPLKWLRFHYNESNNNEAEPPDVRNIDGTIYPLPTGKNKDIGFSVDMGGVTLRINKFENTATTTDAGNQYGNDGLRRTIYDLENRYNSLMNASALAQGQPPFTQFYLASDTKPGFDTLNYGVDRYRIYSDSQSKGYEVELGGRVKKLDIRLTGGRTESIKTNIGPEWLGWATDPSMLDRMKAMQPVITGTVTINGVPTTLSFPVVAYTNGANGAITMTNDPLTGARVPQVTGITPRIGTVLNPETGQPLPGIVGFQNIAYNSSGNTNQTQTMYQRYVDTGLKDTLRIRQFEGVSNPAIREWRANLTLAYNFDALVKGLRIGSSVRMRDMALISYFTEDTTQTIGTTTVTVAATNIQKTYFNTREFYWDPFVSYRFRFAKKYNMVVQLNIANILGNRDSYLTSVMAHNNNTFDVNDARIAYYGITDSRYIPQTMVSGEPREARLSCSLEF